jgi:hypothetical protein
VGCDTQYQWRPLAETTQCRHGGDFVPALGLGVVWFARKIADIQDGAVLTSFVCCRPYCMSYLVAI